MLFLLKICAIAASVFYALYMFWYSTRIMELKINKVPYYALIGLSSFLYSYFFINRRIPYYAVYIFMLLIILLIYVISFKQNFMVYFFGACTFIFHLLFVKGIVFSLASIFVNTNINELASNFSSRIFLTMIDFIIASIYLFVFRKVLPDKWVRRVCQTYSALKPLVFVLSFLTGILLFSSVVYEQRLDAKWIGLCFLLLCLVISFCLYYVLCIRIENIQKDDFALRASSLEHQLQIQMQHYNAQLNYIENMRKIKHDYLNQLHGLSFLLENADLKGMENYISEMLGNIQTASSVYKKYSNNKMLDAILQDIAIRCEQSNITFDAFVHLPDKMPMSDYDLCTIFSNLMDNAMEATALCADNRFITIKQKNVNKWAVIIQQNSYDGTLLESNGKIQTRKEDHAFHGIGIQAITDLTKKYGGYTQFVPDFQNKIFTVSIFLHN